MDAVSRKHVQELFRSEKINRLILFATQSMEDVELLADRIAFMTGSSVYCCGSASFLKRKLCGGYNLTITTKPACDMTLLQQTVHSEVPSAHLQSNIGRQLLFNFPRCAINDLHRLLTYLERNISRLNILNLKAGMATLDDVFHKVVQNKTDFNYSIIDKETINITPDAIKTKSDLPRHISYNILLSEKARNSVRNLTFLLANLLLVAVFVVASCSMAKVTNNLNDLPQYSLTVDNFYDPVAPYLLKVGNVSELINNLGVHYKKALDETKTKEVPLVNDESWFTNDTVMDDYLERRALSNFDQYYRDIVTAATFSDDQSPITMTGHFNNEAYHTPAISLNLLTNTLIKYMLNDSYGIRLSNHPLPRDDQVAVEETVQPNTVEALTIAFCTLFGFVFLTSSFTPVLVRDRKSGWRRLQSMNDVSAGIYWLSSFLWDYVVLIVSAAVTVCIIMAFQLEAYLSWEAAGVLISGFLLYGWGSIPLNYLLTFLFDVPESAYTWITVYNTCTSSIILIALKIMSIPGLDLVDASFIIEWIFCAIFPHFAFQNLIVDLVTNYGNRKHCTAILPALNMSRNDYCQTKPDFKSVCCPDTCQDFCALYQQSTFAFFKPGVGRLLMFLSIQGLVSFLIIAFIESNTFYKIRQKISRHEQNLEKCSFDDNVDLNDDVIQMRYLSKHYGLTKAVTNLTGDVRNGDVLAIVGVSGAGKSTVLKILTGEEPATDGEVILNGTRISQNKKRFLGYSSQTFQLSADMTVKEILSMFSRLRGVNKKEIPHHIENLLENICMLHDKEKNIRHLSYGTRRKLSAAIALIGEPSVILLDEPTVGLDPVTKAWMWNTISLTSTEKRAIIITLNSIDECLLVANRALILNNGYLKAADNVEALSANYCDGCTLYIRIQPSNIKLVQNKTKLFINYAKIIFPDGTLKSRQIKNGLLIYKIDARHQLSDILEKIEMVQEKYSIVDYSVSFVSLEHVFLKGFVIPARKLSQHNTDNSRNKDKAVYYEIQDIPQTSSDQAHAGVRMFENCKTVNKTGVEEVTNDGSAANAFDKSTKQFNLKENETEVTHL